MVERDRASHRPAAAHATPDAPGIAVPQIDAESFRRIQRFLETESGVHLADSKTSMVVARLNRRLRETKSADYRAYLAVLDVPGHPEQREILDRLLTNETSLFREPWQFEFLESEIVPQWRARRDRRIRVWSAACSTGEEPASLAALLARDLPAAQGFDVQIVATDLSRRALGKARTLEFPVAALRSVRASWAREFSATDREKQRVAVTPDARRIVSFAERNLMEPWRPGEFDLILCRNVLIYFPAERKRQAIAQIWRALRPGGYFFLGHAEGLLGLSEARRAVRPAVYRKPEEAAA